MLSITNNLNTFFVEVSLITFIVTLVCKVYIVTLAFSKQKNIIYIGKLLNTSGLP